MSNPLGRPAVGGNVTLDGVALDQGTIEFSPESANGVSSGATIANGVYGIPTIKGLPPGRYLVRITSVAATQADAAHSKPIIPGLEGHTKPAVDRIPATYNKNSRIRVEVFGGQTARLDFDIKSK